ncbi:hypothetical protein [Thalassiella azotivora]
MSSHPLPPAHPLWHGLVDDAAVFPPGLAPITDAVPAHRRHRAAWYSPVVGPLLVPVAGLDGFLAALAGDEAPGTLDVALVADATADDPVGGLLAAVDRLHGSGAVVHAVEVPLPGTEGQAAAATTLARRLDDHLPGSVLAWVEVLREPATGDGPGGAGERDGRTVTGALTALDALAAAPGRVRAKFRTGGVRADLFPTAGELAAVLHHARGLELPLKLTAGLHHAIRHTDPRTGFAHHGFLNVLLATAAAVHDGDVDAVAFLLQQDDPERVTAAVALLDDPWAVATRRVLASFGCCGVTDPVDDLVALGLLARPGAATDDGDRAAGPTHPTDATSDHDPEENR